MIVGCVAKALGPKGCVPSNTVIQIKSFRVPVKNLLITALFEGAYSPLPEYRAPWHAGVLRGGATR